MGDLSCDLECVKKLPPKPKIREFIGTVKILLVDTPAAEYVWKRIDSGLISLSYFMMGFNVMITLFYTLMFQHPLMINLHIMLCTLGYQLCIPCGILIMNGLSGSSHVLKLADRKLEHLCLQLFGLGLGIAGTVAPFFSDTPYFTTHSIFGIIAGGFGFIAMLFGPLVWFLNRREVICPNGVHMYFGIISLITSSVCFVMGINRYCVYKWLPGKHMSFFIYLFCFLYTAIISKKVFASISQDLEK